MTTSEIATYGDISSELKGKRLEQLFSPQLLEKVRVESALTRSPSKKRSGIIFSGALGN